MGVFLCARHPCKTAKARFRPCLEPFRRQRHLNPFKVFPARSVAVGSGVSEAVPFLPLEPYPPEAGPSMTRSSQSLGYAAEQEANKLACGRCLPICYLLERDWVITAWWWQVSPLEFDLEHEKARTTSRFPSCSSLTSNFLNGDQILITHRSTSTGDQDPSQTSRFHARVA